MLSSKTRTIWQQNTTSISFSWHKGAREKDGNTPQSASGKRNIPANELFNMLEYLVDNIYIEVGNTVYGQRVGIPMGTDCAPLLANLFLNTTL